jgi:hypothetical protein
VQGGEALALDLDLGRVFAGWDARVELVEPGSDGDVYTVRFDNRDAGAAIRHAVVVIDASDWLPLRLTLYADEPTAFADLRLMGVEVDTGLDAADVTGCPTTPRSSTAAAERHHDPVRPVASPPWIAPEPRPSPSPRGPDTAHTIPTPRFGRSPNRKAVERAGAQPHPAVRAQPEPQGR